MSIREERCQRLLNLSVEHIKKQGKESADDYRCMYQNPDGSKCAAGIFIDNYDPAMEGKNFVELVTLYRSALTQDAVKEPYFISRVLQCAHDDAAWHANFVERYECRLEFLLNIWNTDHGMTLTIPLN